MRTIGIIGAMEEEISFLREKMDIVTTKSVVGLTYYVGRYEGNNVVLVKSGIGKVNAAVCTQAMIDHFGVDYIINTGVAGGLSPELHVGDILISVFASLRRFCFAGAAHSSWSSVFPAKSNGKRNGGNGRRLGRRGTNDYHHGAFG